ncbi:MAG: ATP-binding protein [Victivallales bacterium]|nr:ATP-binding protein [Victivallales bacterium]
MNPDAEKFSTPAFRKILRLAGTAIARYEMIRNGDRILVGVSGGKDSLLLLQVLAQLRRRAPVDFELVPVCFYPGFPEFNLDGLRSWLAGQGWELQVVTLDIPAIIAAKGAEEQPCVLCSRLRRGHLYGAADRWHCNKLALGQHLDDLCVSLLIGLFRGQGLMTMGPNVPGDRDGKRIIRPLATTPEALIRTAAAPFNFPSCGDCHYKTQLERDGDRAFFRRLLIELEQRIPRVREYMLHSMGDLRPEHLLDLRFLPPLPPQP